MILGEQDFNVMVQIQLHEGFPNEKPIISLNSLYHMEVPHVSYSEVLKDFPYKLIWDPIIMVKKLLSYIKQPIKMFKHNSVKNYS